MFDGPGRGNFSRSSGTAPIPASGAGFYQPVSGHARPLRCRWVAVSRGRRSV